MANVDLPLPVLPRRPIRSLAPRWKETFFNTGGSSGAYLTTKSSTLINGFELVLEGQYAGGRFDSMTAGGSWGRSRYSTTRSTELIGSNVGYAALEHIKETYFKSSSRAVQKRHAQYTLIVNVVALVIQRPAVPAETYPESANRVVISTARPPSVSKLSSSHRFVIQKLYHICGFTRQLLPVGWTRVRKC